MDIDPQLDPSILDPISNYISFLFPEGLGGIPHDPKMVHRGSEELSQTITGHLVTVLGVKRGSTRPGPPGTTDSLCLYMFI